MGGAEEPAGSAGLSCSFRKLHAEKTASLHKSCSKLQAGASYRWVPELRGVGWM